MKDDLRSINKEEEKLQRELLNMKKQNLHKHSKVLRQNHIDTKIQNTEQLVRKMLHVPDASTNAKVPLHMKKDTSGERLMKPGIESLDELQIQESLDNLDMLLANLNNKQGKKEAMGKLSDKYGIKQEYPTTGQYHQPFAVQPQRSQPNQIANQQ